MQTFNGSVIETTVDAEVVQSLKAVGRTSGATMYMVVLAAFQLLLSRYSRQDEVCVGSPYAGRDESATQDMVGYFVNTLAMLVDVSGDPKFAELLGRVRGVVLGAFEHADMPLARIVEALHVARDASRTPVFQAMFDAHMIDEDADETGRDEEQDEGA